jgi:uncharacterized protein (DUF1778 family)
MRITAPRCKGANINPRANRDQKASIDRSPYALGWNRSDFALGTACWEAEVILQEDHRLSDRNL